MRGSKDFWDKYKCQMKDGSALQSSAAVWLWLAVGALAIQILGGDMGPNEPKKAPLG